MAIAPRGVDVRQSGGTVLVRLGIDDATGAALGTGTAALRVMEYQADGSLKQLDFADAGLKTSGLTTPTLAMTARPCPDGTASGLWTAALSSSNVANFTAGAVYLVVASHSALAGVAFRREWQYGGAEGDLALNAAGRVDVGTWRGGPVPDPTTASPPGSAGYPLVDIRWVAGSTANPATTPDMNLAAIGGSTAALAAFVAMLRATHLGVVSNDVPPSSTQFTSTTATLAAPAAHYVGRKVVFYDPAFGTASNNSPASYTIQNCVQVGGYKQFTIQTPMLGTPVVGDPFLILT